MGVNMFSVYSAIGVFGVLAITNVCCAADRSTGDWSHAFDWNLFPEKQPVPIVDLKAIPNKHSPSYLADDSWKPIIVADAHVASPVPSPIPEVHARHLFAGSLSPADFESKILELKPVASLSFLKQASTSTLEKLEDKAQLSTHEHQDDNKGFFEPLDMEEFFKGVGISHQPSEIGSAAFASNSPPIFYPVKSKAESNAEDKTDFIPSGSSFGFDNEASFSHHENQYFDAFMNPKLQFGSFFTDSVQKRSPKEPVSFQSTLPTRVIEKRHGSSESVTEQSEETEKTIQVPQKVTVSVKVSPKAKPKHQEHPENCKLVEKPFEEEQGGNSRYRRTTKQQNKKMLTCLVCERPGGGYAERCSFSSNKPEHKSFTSTSTIKYEEDDVPETKTQRSTEPTKQSTLYGQNNAQYGQRAPTNVQKTAYEPTKDNTLAKASTQQTKHVPHVTPSYTKYGTEKRKDGDNLSTEEKVDRSFDTSGDDDYFKDGFMTSASDFDDFFADHHDGQKHSSDDGSHFGSHDFELSGSSHYGDSADFDFDLPPHYRPQESSGFHSEPSKSGKGSGSDTAASHKPKKENQKGEASKQKPLVSEEKRFNAKDRKNCKESTKSSSKAYGRRSRRSNMKCFTCTDDKGKEREECMLAEHDPHSHHVMFSEYEEY